MDPQEANLVKQRACVKWLLSKAYNNRVPENLKEPFYRDHEGKEHLQPQIVVGLGNATLYCMTLSNLYSDPNYNNRNHFSILQTLSRKGVHVHELGDVQLTETVLIQTNPLRLNAHMSVIEALMVLYAKEIASGDRVASAIARLGAGSLVDPRNYELAFLVWVSHVCAALKRRIEHQEGDLDGPMMMTTTMDERGQRIQAPAIPPLSDFKDLCDGVCLAYLVSFYCPKIVPWTSVKVNYLPTVEDSIHNISLVCIFSQKYLPYSVFHMSPEDITYMRGTMKYNLLVLLADLFNLFEIHPAKCVMYPEMENTVIRSPSGTQLRRTTPPKETDDGDGFIVHRSRGVPTLSSMNEPLIPARIRQAKEKSNNDSKADERGDSIPAGRPSNWGDSRHNTYAGRRSRRNSFSDESQLTIENFGGSQDQINLIGRYDRERKLSNTSSPAATQMVIEQPVAVRSSLSDARGTLQLGYDTDSGSEKQDRDDEKTTLRRQQSVDNVSMRVNVGRQHSRDTLDGEQVLSRAKYSNNSSSNNNNNNSSSNNSDMYHEINNKKTATFATLANPTTWQQQTVHHQQMDDIDDVQPVVDATKLSTIRLKLEEKRRHIEQEKRKLEAAVSKYQQKVGKAAFLQAINKDITGEQLESKWDMPLELKKTPDIDQMDIEQYTQSIAMMNTNLHDIQADIQRLATQQSQIQAQTIQAQQLLQAQQIANLLNQQQQQQQQHHHQSPQQQYGSQHNVSSGYRPLTNSFGSSPHLSQSSTYSSRPPSRDPNQHALNYVNDQGQYIQGYQQMYVRENSQTQMMGHNPSSHTFSPNHYQQQQQYQQQDSNHYRDSYSGYQQSQNQQVSQQPEPVPQQSNNSTTFFLHDQPPAQQPQPPVVPQRRTWAQSAQMQQIQQQQQQIPPQPEMTTWTKSKIDTRTWKSPNQNNTGNDKPTGGFMLHQQNGGNGGGGGIGINDYGSGSSGGSGEQSYQNLFPVHASPQHRQQHRQISQMMSNESTTTNTFSRDNRMPMSPPVDVMAPQSISFIGDAEAGDDEMLAPMKPKIRPRQSHEHINTKLEQNLAKLNITSGNRTYRIPSPTRPSITPTSFQDPQDDANEKGFYISFDNEQPKRPKPPLRTKRSPKKEKEDNKEKSESRIDTQNFNGSEKIEEPIAAKRIYEHKQSSPAPIPADRRHLEDLTNQAQVTNNNNYNQSKSSLVGTGKDAEAIIIADNALDPNSIDEMEKRKEKIMLLSLQRRQQQEEAKARKEIEAAQRREREREKEEERARKKDEQIARRAIILEQHKLKKAIEEAEREGKTVDKDLLMQHKMLQQQTQQQTMPKMRAQKVIRPRPKTIHVETGSVDLSEASSISSRGKRGSNSNLTGVGLQSTNSMRRDYYRGSQDSLAMRESPDEYPSSSSTPLGRRGSYKNGRDSDSGLGRATPPRRAPSPGMGPGARHLPSPSGPGSLPPGLMTKRRIFDDGSSDISSAASSMMDYSGPKLYKQPATKSNRGIILNAVEYCVFPGVVNRDAKQKVLEKIARSEAKHFLVLFRDAGCQFRALYGYWPESETILKLYGTGPSQVDDVMFDKFFKYNSGGKCFAQVHTKHLTVTIDAFTIHNSLWQGKKVTLPSKKDMALVI